MIRALLFLLVAVSAHAETLTGVVVGVTDGDTVTLLAADNRQFKIRLAGIDAPEKAQPFGDRSKQYLAALTFNKKVVVEWDKLDRYGRTIGKVLVNGDDANLELVKAGMAWWYQKYSKEQSATDRRLYDHAEREARARALGLWQNQSAVPPWDWRKERKQGH